jgi:gamma-glutamylcyclotransferase (GGCT)/AIG2-like uncharacterized protein YtfP
MHLRDLSRWADDTGQGPVTIYAVRAAVLEGWALAFNYLSKSRRGGAANVVPTPGERVHGVVLDVDAHTLAVIDVKEGHPHRYSRGERPRGLRLEDGGPVEAWVYRVTEPFEVPGVVPPRREYRDLLVEAAHQHALPSAWLAHLRSIGVADP